jgi:cytochrome c-type biogenesis protein
MIGGIEQLVDSGPLLLAMPVAAAAGAVTFLSPCCLPLVPGYLSYLTGMSGTAAQGQRPTDSGAMATAAVGAVPLGATVGGAGGQSAGGQSAGARGSSAAGASEREVSTVAEHSPASPAVAVPTRGRAVVGTLLFVLGFSVVFTAEALAFGTLGDSLRLHQKGLDQVLGSVVILLGLLFLGVFDRFMFTGRIFRPQFRPRAGLAGAPLLGVLFGVGWTPCSGPTLTAVISLGMTTGNANRAVLLAFIYALGLGIPFLIVAFTVQRGITMFGFARRHARLIMQIGGAMLIVVGLLEVTGAWGAAITWLQVHWLAGYNSPI